MHFFGFIGSPLFHTDKQIIVRASIVLLPFAAWWISHDGSSKGPETGVRDGQRAVYDRGGRAQCER